VRGRIIDLALDKPELSPRELAVTLTDVELYFVSEASVYRLLKANDLIPQSQSPGSDVKNSATLDGV
jgi:putative transposase